MHKNEDGTVTLTKIEFQSLKKMVIACHEAISQLPSDGDVLGWDNYRALQMWEEILKETKGIELEWFVEDSKFKTINAWLEFYGKSK